MPEPELTTITFKEFLENHPPGSVVLVRDIAEKMKSATEKWMVIVPTIQLYCPSEDCVGNRFFNANVSEYSRTIGKDWKEVYYDYLCNNCKRQYKRFSLGMRIVDAGAAECYKYGELPPFGPHTPTRLISMIGEDKDLFLQGRRCESQGLGIGSFAYYRRVVENAKARLISQIIRVSKTIGIGSDSVAKLEVALDETNFTRSMELMGEALPRELLVKGHNPFTLLHKALSKGIHAKTDAECLESAQSIRLLLAELAERINEFVKENRELEESIKKLLQESRPAQDNPPETAE